MAQTISSNKGQLYVMAVIASGFVGALTALFVSARDGAINDGNQLDALVKIIGFYLPLLAIIGTFYFKDKQGVTDGEIAKARYIFAFFIMTLWILIPILLLSFKEYIETVMSWTDKINALCLSFINIVLAFIFSKDKEKDKETPAPNKPDSLFTGQENAPTETPK